MQSPGSFSKLNYTNSWLVSAKLLSLLIFVYCASFFTSCAQSQPKIAFPAENPPEISQNAVNINTATAEELEKLPRVGRETARKIVERRERYGAFRRSEDLILVDGMTDKKFREIRKLVKVE